MTAAPLCSRACRKLLSSETQNTNRNHFKPLIRTFGFASMLFMHAEKTPVSSPTPALGGSALQWITAGLMVTADLLTESSLNAIYKRIGKLKENPWSLTSRSEKICSSSELLPLMMKHFSCDGSSDFFQDENPADHLWACGRVYAALSSSNTKKCENIPVEEWSSVEIRVNEERAPELLWCHMLIDFCWLFL